MEEMQKNLSKPKTGEEKMDEETSSETANLQKIKTSQKKEKCSLKLICFENRCIKYSDNSKVKPKQQLEFFKSFRNQLLNRLVGGRRFLTEDEKMARIKVFKKYFPQEMEKILEYIEKEKVVQAEKDMVRKQKHKEWEIRKSNLQKIEDTIEGKGKN